MSEQQTMSRSRRIVVTSGLMLFLIGLPFISYLYLKKGFDYHKAALSDLRKTHQLEQIGQLTLLSGALSSDDLTESMYVLGFLPKTANSNYPLYSEVLSALHEQFDQPTNIQFWSIFEQQDSAFVANYQKTHQLPQDTAQLLYWTAAERGLGSFVAQLGLTEEEQLLMPNGLFVLVDDSLYVRRAYQLDDKESVRQLVERIAIILPERKKPRATLRRKEEL